MVSPGPGPGLGPILSVTSPDFDLARFRILSVFVSVSESGIYQASPGPCPCPDFIHFESGSWCGFYQACPCPGPVRVRILPTPIDVCMHVD